MRHTSKLFVAIAAVILAMSSIGISAAEQHGRQQHMQDRTGSAMHGPMGGMQGRQTMPGAGMGPMMGGMMRMMHMSRMMMGPMGPSMMFGASRPSGDKLTADEARRIADGILAWQGNERLKVGNVTERDDDTILIEIMTVDDSLVQRVAMDRTTGMMQPAN